MSWQERIQATIQLVSPSGQEFTAKWAGGARNIEKKLGVFEPPLTTSVTVQDLDTGAVRWPIELYFEGQDHDIAADLFFIACRERGTWAVKHPVRGILTLQLVRASEDIQPITSGGVTKLDTEWIEVNTAADQPSPAAVAEGVRARVDDVLAGAGEQYTQAALRGSTVAEVKKAAGVAVARTMAALASVRQVSGEVTAQIDAVYRGVNATLAAGTLDVVGLSSQLQTLVLLPRQAISGTAASVEFYAGMIGSSLSDLQHTVTSELLAVTGLSGLMLTLAEAQDIRSRTEALAYLDRVTATHADLVATLDAVQAAQRNAGVDVRYTSQAEGANDVALAVGQTVRLLLRRSFDLPASRVIHLARPTTPVGLSLTLGVDLDQLIAANSLKGADILLLSPGRKVTVYL